MRAHTLTISSTTNLAVWRPSNHETCFLSTSSLQLRTCLSEDLQYPTMNLAAWRPPISKHEPVFLRTSTPIFNHELSSWGPPISKHEPGCLKTSNLQLRTWLHEDYSNYEPDFLKTSNLQARTWLPEDIQSSTTNLAARKDIKSPSTYLTSWRHPISNHEAGCLKSSPATNLNAWRHPISKYEPDLLKKSNFIQTWLPKAAGAERCIWRWHSSTPASAGPLSTKCWRNSGMEQRTEWPVETNTRVEKQLMRSKNWRKNTELMEEWEQQRKINSKT